MKLRLRWVVIGVFALANAINFLDRQILAALAPQLMAEFGMTAAGYGDVILAFSVAYAVGAPAAGWVIDRLGLRWGSTLAVGLWSVAGIATGWAGSVRWLMLCRAVLGLGEAGGVPATGKASAVYLPPRERALGSAVFQIGLTAGAMAAPVAAETIARLYGWRAAFVMLGAAGLVWIPVWLAVEKRVPAPAAPQGAAGAGVREIVRDRRYWALLAANVLLMAVYSLWVNWTTVFLVRQYGLTQAEANYHFAWIPPVFATLGGLTGGWLTLRWSEGMEDVTRARMRTILLASAALLGGIFVPWMPTAGWATAVICLSFFACVASSVNLYAMPLDLFGAHRAAFAVSGLTAVYGALQGAFSSIAGRVVDAYGFAPVCVAAAVMPMASWAVLHVALRDREGAR
jgi:ACS family hexuronate transporter-like MFS transporter